MDDPNPLTHSRNNNNNNNNNKNNSRKGKRSRKNGIVSMKLPNFHRDNSNFDSYSNQEDEALYNQDFASPLDQSDDPPSDQYHNEGSPSKDYTTSPSKLRRDSITARPLRKLSAARKLSTAAVRRISRKISRFVYKEEDEVI